MANRKGIFVDLSNENMVHIKKDKIEYLQFKKLLEFENVINCYTLSVNNVDFKRDYTEKHTDILNKSYEAICEALRIRKDNIVRPHQTHSDNIEIVNELGNKYNNVDGLLTNKVNIDCVLTYADCTPILLYDPIKKVIGNIHSGWRGTVQKIGQKAALKMIKNYDAKPSDIIACIGPCIAKCHFEVSEDVKQIFEQVFRYLNRDCDIIKRAKEEGKYFIDTNLINRLILEEIGIKPENIYESNICTVCNANVIHSYRANKENSGRNVAIIGSRR